MDTGEIVRLVAAFIGGGVGKTVLDYALAERTARRTSLRPRDMDRIDSVRALSELILAHYDKPGPLIEGYENHLERIGKCRSKVIELDDDRLEKYWTQWEVALYQYPLQRAHPSNTEDEELERIANLGRLREQLLRRLNDLERKR